ncbi:MAG: VWA domain-containing protein [Gammaproteobacteria bacterium]|nr:VWA domain-containing protein [Gammaproteobacteria bacterium]
MVRPRQGSLRQILLAPSLYSVLAWFCLVIALAGPRLPDTKYQSRAEAMRDIVVVVDLSRSMHAADIEPTRLRRARIELESLVRRSDQSRFAVVVYAARPHVLVPLSDDREAVAHYLKELDQTALPTAGSDPLAAIRLSMKLVDPAQRPAAILLLSDGGYDRDEARFASEWRELQAQLQASDLPIFVLAMASASGAAVPDTSGVFLSHESEPVISRLDERRLRLMSETTGGDYREVSADDSDWIRLYDEGMARLGLSESLKTQSSEVIWKGLHRPFIIAGLVLLVMAWLPRHKWRYGVSGLWAMALISMLVAVKPASADIHTAYSALQRGDYEAARQTYRSLLGYSARMGEGAAHYRLGQFEAAARQFTLAFLKADTDRDRAEALFNLANSQYQLGNYAGAESLYADVLRYADTHRGARVNLAYATALKKEVEQRLGGDPASRVGRGPRQADAAEDLDLSAGGISLGEGATQAQAYGGRYTDASMDTLIERGIRFSTLASQEVESIETLPGEYGAELSTQSPAMTRFASDDGRFWQRMFEIEEGFPAPVTKPRVLPGRNPW